MQIELLAIFPPLVAFLATFLFGKALGSRAVQLITCACMLLAAGTSCYLFFDVAMPPHGTPRTVALMEWISVGDFKVDWALRVDQLAVVMMCVVNIVSACVHVYSVGYMSHDAAKSRFMSYLSLFTFAMLMLVTADNLVQLFFGWEGVGLASYLLIGFWNEKPSANAASNKAFVVNRVGDLGLALGIMACFLVFGGVSFDTIFAAAAGKAGGSYDFLGMNVPVLDMICLLLFVGACGKSAQLGLHTWLPDAMEGPTPVSALIHAATMVTAGVFLVARFSPVFEYAPAAREVVTIVGALTCFVAATIGLTQFDIKRVIAYSTMSQLGYMFFALGVSAYSAAMFHLMTHAFFKALLFLGAGSVIHAMSNEQDMRKMGGLWKLIPTTYVLMWIGSLALAGIPPFAGYFSKDVILEAAFADHVWFGEFAWWMGILAAFMTAFYSGRLLFMTFHGKSRADHDTLHHVHESPTVMIAPLLVLATGAIFAGWVFHGGFVGSSAQAGHSLDAANITGRANVWDKEHFWGESLFVKPQDDTVEAGENDPGLIKLLPTFIGLAGLLLSWVFYVAAPALPGKVALTLRPLYQLVFRKWYFDELYAAIFVRPVWALGRFFSYYGDRKTIDGLGPDGLSFLSSRFAGGLRLVQTGVVYHYAFVMLIGLIALVSWVMFAGVHQ